MVESWFSLQPSQNALIVYGTEDDAEVYHISVNNTQCDMVHESAIQHFFLNRYDFLENHVPVLIQLLRSNLLEWKLNEISRFHLKNQDVPRESDY